MTQDLADLFGLTLPFSWKRSAHKATGYQIDLEPHITTSLMKRIETPSC